MANMYKQSHLDYSSPVCFDRVCIGVEIVNTSRFYHMNQVHILNLNHYPIVCGVNYNTCCTKLEANYMNFGQSSCNLFFQITYILQDGLGERYFYDILYI